MILRKINIQLHIIIIKYNQTLQNNPIIQFLTIYINITRVLKI